MAVVASRGATVRPAAGEGRVQSGRLRHYLRTCVRRPRPSGCERRPRPARARRRVRLARRVPARRLDEWARRPRRDGWSRERRGHAGAGSRRRGRAVRRGRTLERWELLASLAAGDLSVARVAEAHLDALAILAESGASPVDDRSVWGVYAAEGSGPSGRRDRDLDGEPGSCRSEAVVLGRGPGRPGPRHRSPGEGRRLFAIDLHSATVEPGADRWFARGLADVRSTSIVLDGTPATPVGETGWYLTRPGFAWGGIGVAACWFGGLVGVARRVWQAGESREPDQIAALHLGAIDLRVTACRLALADAADLVDSGHADGSAGVLLAERVRGIVSAAVDFVVGAAAHALGPAPLAIDEVHARRVADLELYVRQHHAERDSARLGQLLWAQDGRPW